MERNKKTLVSKGGNGFPEIGRRWICKIALEVTNTHYKKTVIVQVRDLGPTCIAGNDNVDALRQSKKLS
jgi:hypothetical protein